MKVVFVDKITLGSLLRIWAFGDSVRTIWHFEPISPSGQRFLSIFRRMRLIRAGTLPIEHQLSQARSERGESAFLASYGDVQTICARIRQEQLAVNPLINSMSFEWDLSKVLLHFVKLVEQEIQAEFFRIRLLGWILRTRFDLSPETSVLMIERNQWFSYVKAYAGSQGIVLLAYREPWSELTRTTSRLLSLRLTIQATLRRTVRSWLRRSKRRTPAADVPDQSAPGQQRGPSTLAIDYVWKNFTIDATDRSSALYWLERSGIPFSEVLLYGYSSNQPLSAEALDQLGSKGLRVLGRGPGIPAWLPSRRWATLALRIILKLIWNQAICLARGQSSSPYYFRKLAELAVSYAYWHDFYAANRVLLNVTIMDRSTVAQMLALDALQAVSCTFQYTFGLVSDSSPLACAGENIQFVFSSAFAAHLRGVGAPVDTIVDIGYTFDGAIQVLRAGSDSCVRRRLLANGARFIICFLDENSSDTWDSVVSNEDAAGDYEYLMDWLLADPFLGIVFKPKRPATLFKRIARVADLIERARKTGRCQFLLDLDRQTLTSNTYAAEAALMADVCIGNLFGTTAPLEARLAGVRTLLIDHMGCDTHPFHTWGLDHIIFKDWETLRAAIEQYRAAPEAFADLGDWSAGLGKCDPFRDGQASLRMGLFVRWTYEALKQGKSKEESLAAAAEQFAKRWGAEHVTIATHHH